MDHVKALHMFVIHKANNDLVIPSAERLLRKYLSK